MYQRYLRCFIDEWKTCTSQEDCENSGDCTDRSWTTITRSDEDEYPIDVQIGACFNSGVFSDWYSRFFLLCWNRASWNWMSRFLQFSLLIVVLYLK